MGVSPKREPNGVGAIERRSTSRSLLNEVKAGKPPRHRTRPRGGTTFTTSFTLSAGIDQVITDMAIEDDVSRSAIVRVAVMRLLDARSRNED